MPTSEENITNQPVLSIIIVNWKSAGYTEKCLASVFEHEQGLNLEVIVIDNASFDGCGEMIQRAYPRVQFIQSEENLGFARANNVAFGYSKGEILLFLNPDTEIISSALQEMLSCILLDKDAGVVGGKLLNSDLTIQTSCLQPYPSILNQFFDSDFMRKVLPLSPLWGNRALFEDCRAKVPVQGISGACMMMRRNVFEGAGYFSEDYFMYVEDMDLCWKVQHLGKTNYYIGTAVVVHHGGKSSDFQSSNHFSSVAMRESLFAYFQIRRGKWYAQVYRVITALAAAGRVGMLVVARVLYVRHPKKGVLLNSMRKWLAIGRWAIRFGARG